MDQLIDKYFLGELDAKAKIELLRKVKSDQRLKAQFTDYQNRLALLSLSDLVINENDTKRGYHSFIRRNRKNKIFSFVVKSVKYAAAVILIVLFVHFYHIYNYPPQSAAETTLYVPPGQRIQITLQDGTDVWLNAQTRITYPTIFTEKERRVIVEGEAFFKVAKDDKKPFIVSAKNVDIKVLGTEFNLYSYPGEELSRVSLIEGSLQVSFQHSDHEEVTLKPNEEVSIRQGQMLVAQIPDKDYFLWRDGIYSFANENLEEILKKLELYYDIDIVVKDPSILDWKYTVKFRQRDGIDEILRLLQRIHKFSVHRNEENNRITIV